MTTKDQAIAWYSQTPKKTRVTQINMDGEDGWMPLFPKPPAPDSPVDIELAQFKRMFEAACVDLGLINEALGLDPNDGGAEPILDAIAELKQPPAPDCRTCTDYDRLEGCLRAPRYGVCTNGDQYQPAPAVVLWRTE